MTDYKKLYYTLFNGISEVTAKLQKCLVSLLEEHISEEKIAQLEQCISELKQIQLTAEEMYIVQNEPTYPQPYQKVFPYTEER